MKTAEQSRQRKEESLDLLRQCFEKSQIAIFTDYRGEKNGLTVKEISELRAKLRENNAEYRVAKNTLIRKTLHEAGIKDADSYLEGPTAVTFGYGDPAAAAKTVIEFSKTQKPNNLPTIKAAIMENRLLSSDEIKAIAELPSLDVLRMQLLGLMLAPHRNIMGVINASGRSMATVLDAWNKKREEA
ncbi:MAG: 50S ribosomal protein L10 [bacterium]|nr:50S ribosomal protein L10 [bacterium]